MADRERLTGAAEDDLLMGDQAGNLTLWMRTPPLARPRESRASPAPCGWAAPPSVISRAVRRDVPEGASTLSSS